MMNTNTFASFVSIATSLLWASTAAHGVGFDSALGNAGEIFTVTAGSQGELLPGDDSRHPETPLLALDIRFPDGSSERFAVPGTGNEDIESDPGLLYDKATDRLTVVWRSEARDGSSRAILLTTSEGPEWSAISTLWESSADTLGEPLLVVTQDTHSFTIDDQRRRARRGLIHLVWKEHIDGRLAALYSPVVLVQGTYIGWNEAFDLSEMLAQPDDPDGATSGDAELGEGMRAAMSLEESPAGDAVIVTFADGESGAVISAQARVLPLELGFLSEEVRRQVIDVLANVDPGDVSAIAGGMRVQIISMGLLYGYHPAMLEVLAQEIDDWLQGAGDQASNDPEGLADAIRDLTLQVTAELLGEPGGDGGIIQIDIGDILDGGPEPQLIDLQLRSRRPAPATDAERVSIHASADGEELLVAWPGDGALVYVESTEDADAPWSEAKALELGDDLSLTGAHQLLRQRLR